MELVFEADGEAMKWPNRLVVFGIVVVQVLGSIERFVKEDFVEAIVLKKCNQSRGGSWNILGRTI